MHIGVDIGGTFTDVIGLSADGGLVLATVPTRLPGTSSTASPTQARGPIDWLGDGRE